MLDDGTPGATSAGGNDRGILVIFMRIFSRDQPTELASDVHRTCPAFTKENTF